MRVKTEARRRAILEAAKHVFLERGFSGASMAEVAARTGGSKQTIYSYFPSKEELFVAMMLEKGAVMIEPIFEQFENCADRARALRDFAAQLIRFLTDPEVLAFRRIIYAEGARSNLGKLYFENGPKPGWMRIAEDVRRAMDAGQMRRGDPWMAVQHFSALCEAGPVQGLLEGSVEEVTDEELVRATEAAVDVFLRAYEITGAPQ